MRLTLNAVAVLGMAYLTNTLSLPHTGRAVDPCTAPATNASVDLGNWLECQANKFFPSPENGAWDVAYDETFSKDLLASFNQTKFDFNGFKALYATFNASIGLGFKYFRHGFQKTVAVPNSNGDKGGFVYMTGWEGGETVLGTEVWYEDGAFAVVEETADGCRRITEFRESSNIPNQGALPASQNWTCGI